MNLLDRDLGAVDWHRLSVGQTGSGNLSAVAVDWCWLISSVQTSNRMSGLDWSWTAACSDNVVLQALGSLDSRAANLNWSALDWLHIGHDSVDLEKIDRQRP